jgi:hypothetical protein
MNDLCGLRVGEVGTAIPAGGRIMKRSIILAGWLALVMAATAQAERWVVPAGAHVTGAQGTNWRTDLTIANPTSAEVSVTVFLLEAGRDNSTLERSTELVVAAGGQAVVADVLFEKFSFDGTGALLIDCSDPRIVATTRTYNLLPDGSTYGQFIPAVALADALMPGDEGQIIYLAGSSDYRSNLGFAATTPTAGEVTVDLYDARGDLLGTVNRTLAAFEQYQFNNIFSAAGAPPTATARAVVRATAPIVAYGSVVDRRTGDPVAIMAQRLSEATGELAIPAAARAPGAQGSLWRTDIRAFNPGGTDAESTFTYHEIGVPDKARASVTLTIPAGGILALDDFMSSGLGLDRAVGGIRISSDLPLLVWSKTYNLAATGTFGQSIPAVPVTGEPGVDVIRICTGLSNVGFRSNVGFFNLGDAAVALDLLLRDGGGASVGQGAVELEAGEMNQINDIFGALGAQGGDNVWLSVTGAREVSSYLSVSDNRSNDPVYQECLPLAPACTRGLLPLADAYIRGGEHADTRFGTNPHLVIKGIDDLTFARKIYLVFDLAADGVPESFSTAKLRLTASRNVSTVPRVTNLFGVTDNDDWVVDALAENAITWNNAPRNDFASGILFSGQGDTPQDGVRRLVEFTLDGADQPPRSYELDVTEYVRWALGDNPGFSASAPGGDADGRITLLLAHGEVVYGVDGTEFDARESDDLTACDQPQLVFQP